MHARKIRAACEERLDRLSLPHTFTEDGLVRTVSEWTGRPIVCRPMDLRGGPACGMRVRYADHDLVCYDADAPPLLRLQIIAHELGHIICGHEGAMAASDPEPDDDAAWAEIDWAGALGISGRTSYESTEEQEAELTGSLLLARMYRGSNSPSPWPADRRERWAAMFT